MEEVWKDIVGPYQASDQGRIRNARTGRILKLQMNKYGYLQVCLFVDRKKHMRLASRVVWSAFKGPIPKGMQVNHINEIKTDNRLENLNLMTSKENNNWGTHNERMKKALSRPVSQYDRDGKLLKRYKSLKSAVEKTGYSKGYLSDCCKGRFKICHGYMWKYAQTGQTQ